MAGRSIFICYRREDSIAYAGRLSDHLGAHFGTPRVVMDVDAIPAAGDVSGAVERRVGACDALIAVIGKAWTESRDRDGRRSLDDPEDYVRREIAAALDRRMPVVPVLVGGARMPGTPDLPLDISPLARRSAIEVTDTAFPASVAKLIQTLEDAFRHESAGKRYDSSAVPASALQLPAELLSPTIVRTPATPADSPSSEHSTTASTTLPIPQPKRAADVPRRDSRPLLIGGAVLSIALVASAFSFLRDPAEAPPPVPTRAAADGPAPVIGSESPAAREQPTAAPTETAEAGTTPAGASTLHGGTVTDAGSGLPIGGATIRIDEGEQALTSGRLGEFRFTRLPSDAATVQIQVSAPGYTPQSANVDLSTQSRHLFQLRREASAAERPMPPSVPPGRAAKLAGSPAAMTPLRIGGDIKPPVKIKNVPPVYPPGAQAGNVQGIVIIEATIGPTGNVRQARVLRSIPQLDQAAIDAVQQWTYTPTMLNGAAVPVVMTVTVQFKLVDPRTRALETYVDRLESSKNVGAAMDLLNRVFHAHAREWSTAGVFTTLRNKLAAASDAELTAAFTAIPQ